MIESHWGLLSGSIMWLESLKNNLAPAWEYRRYKSGYTKQLEGSSGDGENKLRNI